MLTNSTSLLLGEGTERTELVLYAHQQTVELDREPIRRQPGRLIRKLLDLAVQFEGRAHVADGGARIGAVRMIRLDLIAPDIGFQWPDGSGERISDAPEPHAVERKIQHVGKGLDIGAPGPIERAQEE